MASDTLALFSSAEYVQESIAEDIYIAKEAVQKVVPRVDHQQIEAGDEVKRPTMGRDTTTTLYSRLTTDNVTFNDTNNSGTEITKTAIDDTPFEFQQRDEYGAFEYQLVGWMRMSVKMRQQYIDKRKAQIGKALARKQDGDVLALANPTLIANANEINTGSPANFDADTISEIYKIAEQNFWDPSEIVCVLDTDQVPYVEQLLGRAVGYRGNPASEAAPASRVFHDGNALTVMFHPDVYDDDSDGKHGLFFSKEGIAFVEWESMLPHEFPMTNKVMIESMMLTSYGWNIQDSALVGSIQTPR